MRFTHWSNVIDSRATLSYHVGVSDWALILDSEVNNIININNIYYDLERFKYNKVASIN